MNSTSLKETEVLKLYGMSSDLPHEFAKNNLDVIVDNLID